jgi:hypothetical protein
MTKLLAAHEPNRSPRYKVEHVTLDAGTAELLAAFDAAVALLRQVGEAHVIVDDESGVLVNLDADTWAKVSAIARRVRA